MQVDVGQERGDEHPLRGSPFGFDPFTGFDNAGLEPFSNEPQDALVDDSVLQEFILQPWSMLSK